MKFVVNVVGPVTAVIYVPVGRPVPLTVSPAKRLFVEATVTTLVLMTVPVFATPVAEVPAVVVSYTTRLVVPEVAVPPEGEHAANRRAADGGRARAAALTVL